MKNYSIKVADALLVIIDIQDSLIKAMYNPDEMMKYAEILERASKVLKFPAVFTTQYKKGLGEVNQKLFSILPEAPVIDKMHFSAMLDEKFVETIKSFNRRQIIISGMETHICVFTTIRDLIAEGYEVFVARDAVSSRTLENKENALEQLREMGAVITNTETILFDLLEKSGSSEFKEIQKLIK